MMKSPFDEISPIPKIEMLNILDLRPYSRRSEVCLTEVLVETNWSPRMHLWIQAGEVQLRMSDSKPGIGDLKVYWKDVVDEEHDSAYIMTLPLIGVRMESVHYHATTLIAWIDPNDYEGFRIPANGFPNPSSTKPCHSKHCKDDKPHNIGPYIPPMNSELFTILRGRKLEISIGPVREKDA